MFKVYQQLSKEDYLNQQQLEQRFESKSGKGARHRNISMGVQKIIDVDELPVNGRAVPLSSRYVQKLRQDGYKKV